MPGSPRFLARPGPAERIAPAGADSPQTPNFAADVPRGDTTAPVFEAMSEQSAAQPADPPSRDTAPVFEEISEQPAAPAPPADTALADSSAYIPLSEFTIAGTQRYTIDNSPPMRRSKLKPLTTLAVGSTYFGILTALHIYQVNTIWNENTKFRIVEDIDQDFFSDKFGHFWGTYFNGYCSTEALIGAGFSVEMATIVGGLMGLAYQGYIEVMDGFGKNWGFSPSDMVANTAGFLYYMAQYYVPFLQNFTFKATYFPAPWYNEKPRREASMFIDDYSSWTWWLSAKMCNLTPASWKWPRWLDLAAGYAVRDLRLENGVYLGSQRFVIGLDYNLVELLPDGGNFINWLKQSFNYFKFPAPAIEFGEGARFRLFYPFVFSFGANFRF